MVNLNDFERLGLLLHIAEIDGIFKHSVAL